MKITASHLYNYDACPHRVWRDAHDNPNLRDDPNEFVQLLWEQGTQYEKEVLENMEGDQSVLDLSILPKEERAQATLNAMSRKEPLLFNGSTSGAKTSRLRRCSEFSITMRMTVLP